MNFIAPTTGSFYPHMEFLLYVIYGKIHTIQTRKLHIFGVLCEAKENIGS